jgi:hypothetical protein
MDSPSDWGGQAVPATHGALQLSLVFTAPASPNRPAAHGAHAAAPPLLQVPGGHTRGADDPVGQK